MPIVANRQIVRLLIAGSSALLVSGCGLEMSDPATPVTTATPASSPQGPLTDQELGWLEAISRLHRTMDSALTDSPPQLTVETLGPMAEELRRCTPELTRFGPATERLQPVYQLAQQACAQYEEGAMCLDTAANIGTPIMGTDAEQELNQAIDCGFSAPGKGSKIFADAEMKGFEIKEAAG